jgi:hypothetical protein
MTHLGYRQLFPVAGAKPDLSTTKLPGRTVTIIPLDVMAIANEVIE